MKGTMTGNRVLLKLKGKTIGGGTQNADFNDDFGLQDVDGLGDPEVQELVIGKVTHTISISRMFIHNKKLIDLGLVPTSDEYLNSGELEIEVLDKVTQAPVEVYEGCKIANWSRRYNKHVTSSESATFRARHRQTT